MLDGEEDRADTGSIASLDGPAEGDERGGGEGGGGATGEVSKAENGAANAAAGEGERGKGGDGEDGAYYNAAAAAPYADDVMAAYAEVPYGEYGPSDDFGGAYWEVSFVFQEWSL